jgi:hypothetical protein
MITSQVWVICKVLKRKNVLGHGLCAQLVTTPRFCFNGLGGTTKIKCGYSYSATTHRIQQFVTRPDLWANRLKIFTLNRKYWHSMTCVFFFYWAPAADAPDDVLQPCRLIVPPVIPTPPTKRETPSRERGNCGREMTGNFADKWRVPRHL